MKKQTLQEQLNIYFDAEEYLQGYAKAQVYSIRAGMRMNECLYKLGADKLEMNADLVYDIIDNELNAEEKGEEPNRTIFYRCVYPKDEEGKEQQDAEPIDDIYITYTREDYEFLRYFSHLDRNAYINFDEQITKISADLINRFEGNVDLIKVTCMQALRSATKKDLIEFTNRVKTITENIEGDEERNFINNSFSYIDDIYARRFLQDISKPFKEAIEQIHIAELQQLNGDDLFNNIEVTRNNFDLIYKETRELNQEIQELAECLFKQKNTQKINETEIYNRLAQDKMTNALQTLNLSRDQAGIRSYASKSGRNIIQEQVFENNGIQIITGSINNVSLSTETRQINDYLRQKLTQQIPVNCTDLNVLQKCKQVTIDLDEMSRVFGKDKKDCRRLLNEFYFEVRDLKLSGFEKITDAKGNVTERRKTINLFTADEIEVEYNENNATAEPKDVEVGTQITLQNTGTLLNYNPKQKVIKKPSIIKKGKLTMDYSTEFALHVATKMSIMPHNPKLYALNMKKYKPAYAIGEALEVHNYQNRNGTNANIISLGTLLKNNCEIPTYDTVMAGNKNVADRIQKVLFKNIEALKEIGVITNYSYYDPKHKTTEAEMLKMDYATFIKCTLHFELEEVPRTTLIEQIK